MPALENIVNVGDMPTHEVLRRLWNASCSGGIPKRLGFDRPLSLMSEEEARMWTAQYRRTKPRAYNFDWLQGRILKVYLDTLPLIDVRLYDRDNGQGAAARALGLMP